MSELLPCPFCGGEAVLHQTYDMDTGAVDGRFAWCDNDTCECKPETGQFFTEAEAIAAWNSRAERTCHIEGSYYDELMDEHYTQLSCDHETGEYEPNYCPKCGCKVVGE